MMINKFICFLLLISLICFSLTLVAQDSDSETIDMEEDSDRFDSDCSDEFLVEDESEKLDYESDVQSKTEDEVQLKPTDATSIKLINLYLKALDEVENLKAINTFEILPPENMSKGDIVAFAQKAKFYNHLIDWREKGHRFNYIDKIKVRKEPTYFVQGKIKDGHDVFYYFDPQNFLLRHFSFKERFAGLLVDTDYIPVKFTNVKGVWMEEKKQYVVEGPVYKEINYGKFFANIDIPASLFEVPDVKEFILRQKSR